MFGRLLLAGATAPGVRRTVLALPGSSRVVSLFIAGESQTDAIRVAQQLAQQGFQVTIDHLGEDTTDLSQAAAAADSCVALLDDVYANGLAATTEVSIKLTALGLALPDGEAIAFENAARIVRRAAAVGTTVTVDMEDHAKTAATLAVVRWLREIQPTTGLVLQAYLHRTPHDIDEFAALGARIRLCKGAYNEPETVALTSRSEIDRAYELCLTKLFASNAYPMVATHDPKHIALAASLAERHSKKASEFEYQLLNGIRPDEQQRLVESGATVRVYLPYGNQWYGYMMRRMAEKPSNLALFLKAMSSRS